MPQLTVLTNVSRDKVPEDFLKNATQIMVNEIKKDAKVCGDGVVGFVSTIVIIIVIIVT